MTLKEIIRKNIAFILPCIVFWMAGVVFSLLYSKVDIQLWFNGFNRNCLDGCFYCLTYLGDGLVFLPVLVFALMYSFRFTLQQVVTGVLCVIAVQSLKSVFAEMRPYPAFEALGLLGELKLVDGVDFHYARSFPSGHTATIFSLLTIFVFYAKRWYGKLLLFFFALIVAYSRVYLMQHFFVDILAGSFIGVLLPFLVYYYTQNSPWFNKISWIDSSFAEKFKRSV